MKLFTPGPITMDQETIKMGGVQQQYFRTPQFSNLMLQCMEGLKKIVDAPIDSRVIFLTASGSAAMEATVINLFTKNDKVLIIESGTFGKRFAEICDIHEIPYESIKLNYNEPLNYELLNNYENKDITGMLINVCETSTGQLFDMELISSFCKKNHIFLVADAISSFMCDSYSMKQLEVSATIISSQKGLGLQPGMAYVILTKEVFEERVQKNKVKSLYFRFTDYYPEILRGQTNFTPAIGIINQLHEKLQRIQKNGVSSYVEHCETLAEHFRNKIIDIEDFTISKIPLSNCVTPVFTGKFNAKMIVDILRDEYDIYVIPAAGELSTKMFRVSHMSTQLTIQDLNELIEIISKIVKIISFDK